MEQTPVHVEASERIPQDRVAPVAREIVLDLCRAMGHDPAKVTSIHVTAHEVVVSYVHRVADTEQQTA